MNDDDQHALNLCMKAKQTEYKAFKDCSTNEIVQEFTEDSHPIP